MDAERNIAIKAAREAGRLLKARLGNIKRLDYKGAFNVVTDVDVASEKLIVEILKSQFPDYGILAEEGTATQLASSSCWVIDPLDGTTNYTHTYPFFAVSIGLEHKGKVVLGVVYNPLADELFWAAEGNGAWLGPEQIKVSAKAILKNSLLATGFPYDTRNQKRTNLPEFCALTNISCGVRRDGAAALDLCFVACGRLDGFWERQLAPWDMAAGSIIVLEAGGKITNPNGKTFDIKSGHILASNGLIHEAIITELEQGITAVIHEPVL